MQASVVKVIWGQAFILHRRLGLAGKLAILRYAVALIIGIMSVDRGFVFLS